LVLGAVVVELELQGEMVGIPAGTVEVPPMVQLEVTVGIMVLVVRLERVMIHQMQHPVRIIRPVPVEWVELDRVAEEAAGGEAGAVATGAGVVGEPMVIMEPEGVVGVVILQLIT
jgi:hypothetical protein